METGSEFVDKGTSVPLCAKCKQEKRGVCKTRNTPGTPRNTPENPGIPPEQPGTARNNPGTPLEHPIIPWNTLETDRNTPRTPK